MSKHTETGMGKGRGWHADKRTYNPEELADKVVDRVIMGKGITPQTTAKPMTDQDRTTLARYAGEAIEVFNERVALKLREVGDLALARIKQKLENDEFKPGELGFIYSVAQDKRLALDGSRQLANATVNVQVNNFGMSKEQLLAELDGLGNAKPVAPVAPTENVG